MRLEVGQTIARFEIQAQIGSGGTALVYRVVERATGKLFALKVLSLHGPAIRERMIREGQLQASLRHPNIVPVHEVVPLADGSPALLMEYIDGPSLERALTRYRLALPDAELLFLGIVAGVRMAHAAGLVHRDLKPANVLLARTREGFVPKVTDFGLAKMLAEDPSVLQTRNGIPMGTPAYMAPEQIRDARRVDRRADLFGLGCILYEVVTFQRTFLGDDALALYNAITHGQYIRPREILPDLPVRLDLAIRGCLLTERSRRIPDCDTLIRVMQGMMPWDCGEVPGRLVAAVIGDGYAGAVLDSGQGAAWPGRGDTDAPLARATGAAVRLEDAETVPYVGPSNPRSPSGDARSPSGDARSPSGDARSPPGDAPAAVSRPDATLAPSGSPGWLGFAAAGTAVAALVVLLGVAFTSLGVAVWWQAEPDASPAVAPASAPMSAPTPAPLPAPPPPAVAVPVPPPVNAPRPQPVPVAPVAKPTPKPSRPEPAAPAANAVVKLLTDPPTATVVVDGAPRGRTPVKLDLPPGRHAVSVESGSQRAEFVIEVRAGVENKWCYAFASSRNHAGPCP